MIRNALCKAAFAVFFGCAAGAPALAASGAAVLTVESVLSPVWIERANGAREPLAIDTAIANKDRIVTGEGGRAMLRLAEGSAIKLGESALIAVDDLLRKPAAKSEGVVAASLDVVRGAFRFTTGLLSRPSAPRDVRIKVNAVTAGIRGTDLWGKSAPDRDVVCLFEGRISVTHGAAQFTMDEPMSFYIAPRSGAAQPPSRVSAEQARQWSAETEIVPRSGALRRGGKVAVTAATAADERAAAALRDKLRTAGFPATLTRGKPGAGLHEVRIGPLVDAAEAKVLAQRLQALGYRDAR